jgi:hypothetical protein
LREKHTLKVFESGLLRKMFGPKSNEVTGEWRRLHNEELYDIYPSLNIIRVMKSRRICVVYLPRMGDRRGATGFRLGDLRERHHLEHLGVGGRTVLK